MQVCCNDNSGGAYSSLVSTSTGSPASVTFDRVTKVYDNVTAVKDFSLDVAAGEFMVFVGPSGCG
jgi:ABC-type bacteriocin/lantibiotic exporter with double-glycine peptidase domain